MVKRSKQERRSNCPITNALELIGDRWTMVVLRDMFVGKKRYSEFLASPEGISTNILADRLGMMESSGLIEAKPYQQRPLRLEYVLTDMGMGLLPVLQELCRWGNSHLPYTFVPPADFMEQKVR
ncbi:MAG TPA: helix-turn-helix domain-containing protein [Xanthomonadales bacterium]|nr:helix-turn-helix domain-containing protein [Xanthomonadales bacterium]